MSTRDMRKGWICYDYGDLQLCPGDTITVHPERLRVGYEDEGYGIALSEDVLDEITGYYRAPMMALVNFSGPVARDGMGKVRRASAVTVVWVVDATEIFLRFSRLCALDALGSWTAPDVVARYLRTGNRDLVEETASVARPIAHDDWRAETWTPDRPQISSAAKSALGATWIDRPTEAARYASSWAIGAIAGKSHDPSSRERGRLSRRLSRMLHAAHRREKGV